jgi:hypothetical protein
MLVARVTAGVHLTGLVALAPELWCVNRAEYQDGARGGDDFGISAFYR